MGYAAMLFITKPIEKEKYESHGIEKKIRSARRHL